MDRSMDPRDARRLDAAEAAATAGRLTHLTDLKDFRVADGDPDIRGWSVKTADGIKLGKVVDLLVDGTAMKVRYMEVALDKRVVDLEEDKHVLVPIGAARLNDDENVVMVNRPAGDLVAMPEYRRGTITLTDERALYDRHRAASADSRSGSAELYDDAHFDDRNLLGNRTRPGNDEYIVRVKEYVVRNDQAKNEPHE